MSTPKAQAWITLFIFSACYAFSIVDRFSLSLLLEPIKASLALSDLQMGLLQGPAFAICYASFGILLGRLADRSNRRNLAALAIAFWSLCTMAMGLAHSFTMLFMARIGIGSGEAGLMPTSYSILGDRFEKEKLGRIIAVLTVGSNIGSGIGFIGGGAIFELFAAHGAIRLPIVGTLAPWQLTLIAMGAPGIALALLLRLVVKEPVRSYSQARGSITDLMRILRAQRQFYGPVLVSYAALATLIYGVFSWAPAFQMRVFHLSVGEVGGVIGLTTQLPMMFSPLIVGLLSDRMFPKWGPVAAMKLKQRLFPLALVSGLIAFNSLNYVLSLIGLALFAMFATGMFVLAPVALQSTAPPQLRGQMSAVQLLFSNLVGLSVGPILVAALVQFVFPGNALGKALMCHVAITCVIGFVAASLARQPKRIG